MNKQHELIQQLGELTLWYSSLSNITLEVVWHSPIREGKWCLAEIVAHLMRWDEYLITIVLPEAVSNGKVEFPEHDMYNAASSEYARSGMPPAALLKEAIEKRDRLMRKLSEMTEQQIFQPITVNGYTHCVQTKSPYSLGYLILEFIQHDGHHRKQVEEFLFQPLTEEGN